LKLKSVEFTGKRHKFQLELMFFPNTHNGQKQIGIRLCAVNKITANEIGMILPLLALPWLRRQMAEMLAKHDGTEQIEKEAPAQIPKQFFNMSMLL
jgi:hypothetical protein